MILGNYMLLVEIPHLLNLSSFFWAFMCDLSVFWGYSHTHTNILYVNLFTNYLNSTWLGLSFENSKENTFGGGGGRNFFISNLLSIAWKVREVKVHPATVSDSLSVILSRLSTMINRWEEGHSVNIFIPSLSRLTGIFYSTKVNFKGKFQ